mmetsp:Transcript_818/g.1419  ORF Transcript_818/g.1419 Transcript_818/m.1419 type:complete len:82 (-) Transcript_818:1230-1475(-)
MLIHSSVAFYKIPGIVILTALIKFLPILQTGGQIHARSIIVNEFKPCTTLLGTVSVTISTMTSPNHFMLKQAQNIQKPSSS